jgi:23S rRNA (adenine2503-C2)-methyltransferase
MNNLEQILSEETRYRKDQIYRAWFDNKIHSYEEITTLPKILREKLSPNSWIVVKEIKKFTSKIDGTQKALLGLEDGAAIETVLMPRENKKQDKKAEMRYTICISSQVGCPMACLFCATGSAGFSRNLSYREIVDQYRYWQSVVGEEYKIDNIMLMGQGEPLLNYDNVKIALEIFIKYAEIGPSKITISTVGIVDKMEKMIEEKNFPPVRFALSLHGATDEQRKKIIKNSPNNFILFFVDWAKRYQKVFSSRTHFVGIEYIMIDRINDSDSDMKALANIASAIGKTRVNLIQYNPMACNDKFSGSKIEVLKKWQKEMNRRGIICTIRRSQGLDIFAACGQLKSIQKN